MCIAPRLHKLKPIICVFSQSIPLKSCELLLRNALSLYKCSLDGEHYSVSSSGAIKQSWGLRTFASQTETEDQWNLTASVVQQLPVQKLRQYLSDESDQRQHMSFQEFTFQAISQGAAESEQAAEELCTVLQTAGVVLRHKDTVYLNAEEVSQLISMVLPCSAEKAQNNLNKIEKELSDLEAVHSQAVRTANLRTYLILGAGYLYLAAHIVVFSYLTWWELSWDVMEPIAYIVSLVYSLIGYTYFLLSRGNVMDLEPMRQYWSQRFKEKKIAQLEFDVGRYQYLLKLKSRYKAFLR
ncbi:hypothetical protein CEUSTIGMA_g10061.t1 [Chlamydomonas eustigma]|uniref:Calcium uniporter protein C-terminal domain-containing protein n=1 Tax=Chlamydomonas eustigma TaxID=1157962 RepID=A0A250XHR9_9CHLO|nr:hypothetical protein CEUSTIGMA_g10061.t1 [Chlamydomonas eustigma]|eukprot:GAX82635.1 hypothetical protein CEUSTIGMA_g10061.t1 [Chlamydomonas eustigma]